MRNLIQNLEVLQAAVAGGVVGEVLQFCIKCKNAENIPQEIDQEIIVLVDEYEQFITLNAWQLFSITILN